MLDFFEDDQDSELDPSQNLVHHPQQVWGEVRMHASVWYAMYLVSVPFVWWKCCVDDVSAVLMMDLLCALSPQFVSMSCLVSLV